MEIMKTKKKQRMIMRRDIRNMYIQFEKLMYKIKETYKFNFS
jgi:hypothetical protein